MSILSMALAVEAVELARGTAPHQPQQPQVVVDGRGAIHVVFGVGDEIRYCRSEDGGKSFGQPIALPKVHAMSLGMRRGPRVAVTDSTICVTAIGGKQGKGRDGDLYALRSTDGGATWTRPVEVNDAPDAAREGLHAMAAGPKDSVYCVWLDLRNGDTQVMSSVSMDGGKTWGKNAVVYRSPDGSVCECCHPSVAIDPQGRAFVQWRNSLAGARDLYVASSADGGQTWGKATKLGNGSWPLNACPMDGGAIAVDASGKFATTWRRDKSIFLLLSGQREERRLGVGEQPWIAATADGPFVVWLKQRGNSALLLAPGSTSPVELAPHANDPVIVSGPNGRGPIVAVWEVRDAKSQSIQCQVVSRVK
jgi:photosystem II stability/assembly factor-like uncharacterized protein